MLILRPKLHSLLRSSRVLLEESVSGKGAGRACLIPGLEPQGLPARGRQQRFLSASLGAPMVKDNLKPCAETLSTFSLKL